MRQPHPGGLDWCGSLGRSGRLRFLHRVAEAWARYAAEDAAMGLHRGPAEIRTAHEKADSRTGYRLLWYPSEEKQMGSFVVTTGRSERHVPNPQGGEVGVLHGRYVTMWQLQKDGAYRWVWDGGEQDESAK